MSSEGDEGSVQLKYGELSMFCHVLLYDAMSDDDESLYTWRFNDAMMDESTHMSNDDAGPQFPAESTDFT